MKKLFLAFALFTISFSLLANVVLAEDENVICPQPYGGGVVCGVKTHVPVETGLGDNWGLIGLGLLGASVFTVILSKRFKASRV
ncbi:MAG: hypothetical protein HYV90_05835 [Candidatus Woesebacteria bacterium]|nr:MAG: hypothetical protein HYV90_05835 [Candidatus Woesebacteria bacterium]